MAGNGLAGQSGSFVGISGTLCRRSGPFPPPSICRSIGGRAKTPILTFFILVLVRELLRLIAAFS